MDTEKTRLKSTIVEKIKTYIIEQQLSAGSKLPTERKLTEIFGVSRSVVREALSYLENTGVIYSRQGQGAFISHSNIAHLVSNFFFLWQVNHGDIRDIQNLRLLFESVAMDEIVRHQQNDLHELRDRIEDTRHAETKKDFQEADCAFHLHILQATGNDLFKQMTQVITSYFFEVATIELNEREKVRAIEEHESIVHALQDGDAKKAKDILRAHINHTKI